MFGESSLRGRLIILFFVVVPLVSVWMSQSRLKRAIPDVWNSIPRGSYDGSLPPVDRAAGAADEDQEGGGAPAKDPADAQPRASLPAASTTVPRAEAPPRALIPVASMLPVEANGTATQATNRTKATKAAKASADKTPTQTNHSEHRPHPQYGTDKPLNILLFYADDWSFRTLGAMEEALNNTRYKVPRFVKTPNIDKLAARGVLFTHNCVTTSICMVSRASLYTGQYASVHKNFGAGDTAMYAEGKWNSSLWPLLKARGYHSGMVGKWHHGNPPNIRHDFAFWKGYFGHHYVMRDGKNEHVTDLNERDAIKFLEERPADKPFALLVSFFAIHAEDNTKEHYRPQERTAHLYRNETCPVPTTATNEHYRRLPPFLQNNRTVARGRWIGRYDTPRRYQEVMKKTYRMITEVDTAVGNVLRKLAEQNATDETLIVFTTDNGNLHGEHGLAEKWYPYEESVRVPLAILDPRLPATRRGTVNDELTLNIDLAPTLLGAAGVAVPAVMQGRDVAALYLGTDDAVGRARESWRKEFYYEYFMGNAAALPKSLALVSKREKYITWPDHRYEELFLLEDDPYEEDNVFARLNEKSRNVVEEIKGRFDRLKAHAESGAKC